MLLVHDPRLLPCRLERSRSAVLDPVDDDNDRFSCRPGPVIFFHGASSVGRSFGDLLFMAIAHLMVQGLASKVKWCCLHTATTVKWAEVSECGGWCLNVHI